MDTLTREPNWTVWANVPDFSLVEAVALSLAIDPARLHRRDFDRSNISLSRAVDESQEFSNRLLVLHRNAKRLLPPGYAVRDESKISAPAFVKMALSFGWVMPPALLAIAAPAIAQEGASNVQDIETGTEGALPQLGAKSAATEAPSGAVKSEKGLATRERNSLLVIIAALCEYSGIAIDKSAASSIVKRVEEIGCALDDETVRKFLAQISAAVESRKK